MKKITLIFKKISFNKIITAGIVKRAWVKSGQGKLLFKRIKKKGLIKLNNFQRTPIN